MRVHKAFLCHKIPYFDKMFNGGFNEASTNKATFPDDEPQAFEVLMEWVYTGELLPIFEEPKKLSWNPSKVYKPADKICLPYLQDQIIDAWQASMVKTNIVIGFENIREIYDITPDGSKLRKFGLDMMVYAYKELSTATRQESWSGERAWIAVQNCPELGKEFLTELRKVLFTSVSDPRTGSACTYHCHGKGDKCGAKKSTGGK